MSSSLQLLTEYSSSSSSEEDDNNEGTVSTNDDTATGSPASSSTSLFSFGVKTSEMRLYAHLDGNYPTSVQLTLKSPNGLLSALATDLCQQHGFTPMHDEIQQQWHMSLMRPAPLRRHFVASFQRQIQTSVFQSSAAAAAGSEIPVSLQQMRLLSNENESREFLALLPAPSTAGFHQVQRLIRLTDQVVQQFGLPVYHSDRLPHVSVGWRAKTTINNRGTPALVVPLSLPFAVDCIVDSGLCVCGNLVSETKLLPVPPPPAHGSYS